MKRITSLVLAVLMLVAALCGCGKDTAAGNNITVSASDTGKSSEKVGKTDASSNLPKTYEIAATDPHYIVATPDWHAEGYGCGFALTEKSNNKYAIVVACGSAAEEAPLKDAFSALYNDTFNGILMQNYRAKYAQFGLETTETKLADGSAALLFDGIQTADDYGTELNCPIYGYGFSCDGVPFIVAYIVMDESAADDAKRAEMKGYVDEMINTVHAALCGYARNEKNLG